MNTRSAFATAMLAVLAAVAVVASDVGAASTNARRQRVSFADARLKVEYNATDGDTGLQVFVDAETVAADHHHQPPAAARSSTSGIARCDEWSTCAANRRSGEPVFSGSGGRGALWCDRRCRSGERSRVLAFQGYGLSVSRDCWSGRMLTLGSMRPPTIGFALSASR
jgi:hypothetical protein